MKNPIITLEEELQAIKLAMADLNPLQDNTEIVALTKLRMQYEEAKKILESELERPNYIKKTFTIYKALRGKEELLIEHNHKTNEFEITNIKVAQHSTIIEDSLKELKK